MKTYIVEYNNLLKEWDWEANKREGLDPCELTSGSGKKANWICKKGHKWKTKIYHRVNSKSNCPYCCNQKICKDNCLATTHPKFVKEWSNKNILKPTEVTASSDKKVWWICEKGHEWKTSIKVRSLGCNCPYCSNKKVCKDNCLATVNPDLAKKWSNKNKKKPTEVMSNSNKKYWWKCEKCKQEWKEYANNMTRKNYNCPYCSNHRVCKDNCLATTHPKLVKEWHWKKNKIKSTHITAGSSEKIWWKCCKCKHEWKAYVYNRKYGKGCPICKESKGEKEVAKILNKLNIRYKREYIFSNLPRKRFDFALFKKYARKPYAVIEYQGEQHYQPMRFSQNPKNNIKKFFNMKINDKLKKEFCQDNNIKLIEIPYTQFENIKDFIDEKCNNC